MRRFLVWLQDPWAIAVLAGLIVFVSILSAFGSGLNLEEGRNLALILGGMIALPLAFWRSWLASKQVALSEAGHNTDRYQKGVTMLGDVRLSVREAGVFALTELAENNFDRYHVTVIKLLCSFIRDRSSEQTQEQSRELQHQQEREAERERREREQTPPLSSFRPSRQPTVRHGLADIAPDCQTALNSLSELNKIVRGRDYHLSPQVLDLRSTNLADANLAGLVLCGAHLRRAKLHRALLHTADLREANLSFADLTQADLSAANFSDSDLRSANFQGASFKAAYLQGTDLSSANLSGAILDDADLAGAKLTNARGLTVAQLETAKNVNSDDLKRLKTSEQTQEGEVE